MSKYFDDSTSASHPGGLTLSLRKLEELEPELFSNRTFKCGPTCDVDHPADSMRERFAEHLQLGCCGAAVVVSTSPLVIAVHASDLDASVLLRFPQSFVERYGLSVGKRLVAVNSFQNVRSESGDLLYAVDLIPGPARTNWSSFTPCIAEFLSEETELIDRRRRELPEEVWPALLRTSALRIKRMGLKSARDGKPSAAGVPIRGDGLWFFQPIEEFDRAKPSWTMTILKFVLAVAVVVVLIWLRYRRK